jgi:hypothetical protein
MLSLSPADGAILTRSAVNAHDGLADLEPRSARTQGDDAAGVAMSEGSGHGDLRMAACERLAIGAASDGPFDLDQHLTRTGREQGDLANLDNARPDEPGTALHVGD